MEATSPSKPFTLLGGPLHRLTDRLGLVRCESNTIRFGLLLAGSLWFVAFVLALLEGHLGLFFSMEALSAHIRLLVALPLAFVCEAWFDPRVGGFLAELTRSRMVDESSEAKLRAEIDRIARWRDSWIVEGLLLTVVLAVTFLGPRAYFSSSFGIHESSRSVIPWCGYWYWIACMPLFRFVVLRWVSRLLLWTYLLWRLSRLNLKLTPTHADQMAGLGTLEIAQVQLTPLVFAISSVQAATIAEEIYSGRAEFASVYLAAASILALQSLLFVCPLFLFSTQLWIHKVEGMAQYSFLASTYSRDFERKWIRPDAPPAEPLLGTPDLQSLADLTSARDNVRSMSLVPISMGGMRSILIAALLPLLPLALLKLSLGEIVEQFFGRIVGM